MSEHVLNLAASAITSWKDFNRQQSLELICNDDRDSVPTERASTTHRMETSRDSAGSPAHELMRSKKPELKPFPFFYYTDYSTEKDPDPLTPLTFPGRVPNFPAKLHAILSQPELTDIIDWLPHGRSWRVLKPREFESKITGIPKFFEHAKFSSFVRQANGWGFRRITQGPDRNSYYHDRFLRGLPHLCKTMKRPGVAEKRIADPDMEPDFYKISDLHPVPSSCDEESIFLQKTLESGPKARMPIVTGYFKTLGLACSPSPSDASDEMTAGVSPEPLDVPVPGRELMVFNNTAPAPTPAPTYGFCVASTEESGRDSRPQSQLPTTFTMVSQAPTPYWQQASPTTIPAPIMVAIIPSEQHPNFPNMSGMNQMGMQFPTVDSKSAGASFAAGFAAASSQYQQNLHAILSKMAAK